MTSMSNYEGACEYVLDPDDPETWGGEEGDECHVDEELLNEDGKWTCPHDSEGGKNLCLFHLPIDEKDDKNVLERFTGSLNEFKEGNVGFDMSYQNLQFIGAKIGDFDLNENPPSVEGETITVDFSHAEIEGDLDWAGLEFNSVTPQFAGATFRGNTSFENTLLDCGAVFFNATFEKVPTFQNMEFGGLASFFAADFTVGARFVGTTFREETAFNTAKFGGDANFPGSKFEENVSFTGAKFRGDSRFMRTQFQKVIFSDSTFHGNVNFHGSEFNDSVRFSKTRFKSRTVFRGVEFVEEIDFSKSNFNGHTNFSEAKFKDGVNFSDISFLSADFDAANLTEADFSHVTCTGANFERALLNRATLFDADLRGAKLNGTVLGDVRINKNTQFLGHPDDDSDSSPHTISAIRSQLTCVYDPDYEEDNEHENVDKAKSVYQALEELGGKHARPRLQSRSFVRRQDLQKDGYKQVMLGKDDIDDDTEGEEMDTKDPSWEERLIAGARYSRAKVARATLLYGESPWRIIAGSIGFIVLVALLYPFGEWLQPTGEDPITYSQVLGGEWGLLLESLYFSTLTFTTLGMGDYQPLGFGQVLATVNTAFGAILIALLVFVLGRRAAR